MPAWSWSLILGALGGLFHAAYRGGLVMPHKETGADGVQRWNLGFLTDILLGVGAGFVAWGLPLKVVLPVLNISLDDTTVAALGWVTYLLAGWSGGAFLSRFALKVERDKFAKLRQHVEQQSATPGLSTTLEAMSKAKTLTEVSFLSSQLPKVAGGKQ